MIVEDGAGTPLMQGREGMRAEYEAFRAEYPDLRGEIDHRIHVGDYVIDQELIHRWQAEPVRAVAIYHVANATTSALSTNRAT
ncbi:MAG TPA: nuclear transport factor 2 family protein, partial [Gemmatimonadales bacterium]|nr:nuclear transport factor 2 family protein [Gemmatimonadales bacterium]